MGGGSCDCAFRLEFGESVDLEEDGVGFDVRWILNAPMAD